MGREQRSVLLIMPELWLRAAIGAELVERGWDARGTEGLLEAQVATAGERGRLDAIVLDEDAAPAAELGLLALLVRRHEYPAVLLIGRARPERAGVPEGPWRRVLQRPVTVGDVVEAVEGVARAREA